MSVDRPTFHESWHRVSALTPQLPRAVNVQRQHFRGQPWVVVQHPSENRFFRLSEAAYQFVALLDGRRTVAEVWQGCMERLNDAAPTQAEVIDLLVRLYAANLLQGNLAADAQALFKRHRKHVWQQVRGTVGNPFCIRIPLWDPDRFLDRWAVIGGKLFSTTGAILWACLVAAGVGSLAGHVDAFKDASAHILNPQNLPLLYVAIVIVKGLHELGHGFSCKHFGRKSGSGGEVHQMGVTLLFFTPLPYVDASSAWALKEKWQRIVVGSGGMLAELAIASVAAMLWAHSAEGTPLHAMAYNIMIIAGVSSLAFNGNPFLRYDAYYILLDLLEIPNLESRSKMYVGYLVKRYLWGMPKAVDPSHSRGEKGWLLVYAVAATICRTIIYAAIVVFLMGRFFSIGVLLAVVLIMRWLLMPVLRFIAYLATSRELGRYRGRASFTSAVGAFSLFVLLGMISLPDRYRVEGVVEPHDYAEIHMQTAGFVERVLDSGTPVQAAGSVLVRAESPDLEARHAGLLADFSRLNIQRQSAQTQDAASTQIVDEKIAALAEKITRAEQELQALALMSPIAGVWVAPDADRLTGRYLGRGERIGIVADLDHLRIRAIANQQVASRLIADAAPQVAMRVKGRPDIRLSGRIETIIPAGQERLPSAALGYAAGGSTRIDLDDPTGRRAKEPFFEIMVVPQEPATMPLRPGQTLVLRFDTTAKPLGAQAWRSLLQLFQKRLYT